MDRTARGILLAFGAYAAFSCSDASIRLLHGHVNAFELAFIGALLGAAALPIVRRPGDPWSDAFRVRHWPTWLGRAASTAISTVASVIAFTRLPMPEAFALIFLMPAFITLGSVLLLGEHVAAWRWGAVGAGFIGVLVVLRPGFRALDWGHAAAIVTGLSSSVSVLLVRIAGDRERPLSLYSAGLIGPLVFNGLLMLPAMASPALSSIPLILGYGLLAAAGQALLLLAARCAGASRIASPQYSQMIWAVIFGLLIFREPIDRITAIGIVIILATGAVTWARERRDLSYRNGARRSFGIGSDVRHHQGRYN